MADVLHSGTSIPGGHTNAVAAGAAGFMTGSDKTKLDALVTATTAPVSPMFPAAVGSSTKWMKEDANPGLWVPNRNKIVFSDFDLGVGTAANSVVAGTALVFSSTITPMTFGTSSATEFGVGQGSTGASATGLAYVSHGGSNLPYFLTSANAFYMSMKVALPILSTTGVQQYKGLFGVSTGVTTVAGTSGIAFWYDASADTHWGFVMGAGTMTPSFSSVTVTAGQFYHLEIVKLAATTSVDFYIDGANVGTVSANFPSAGLGVNCGITKSVGITAATVQWDWVYACESVPAKRNSSFLA